MQIHFLIHYNFRECFLRNYLENDAENANFKINKQLEVVRVADKNIKKIILQVIDKKKDKAVVNLIYYEE